MTFTRAFHAETLKMKRTLALKVVLLAPVALVLLTLFMASQAPFGTLHRSSTAPDVWRALSRVTFQFWGLLMLPLYITLQTALIAGLDHADNQWKALFARPVPRWSVYIAKLAVVNLMVAASVAILVGSILIEGEFLNWYDPGLGFGGSMPVGFIIQQAAQMTGLAFLFLTIQHWVSLRWRSFSVAVGFGIIAMVTGFAMLLAAGPYGTWPQYFPSALPMLVLARQPQNLVAALWMCMLAGGVVSVAGCIDFCRREVN